LLTPAAIPAAQAASSPVIQRIQQTGVIRIAHRESSVPFSFMADGKPSGTPSICA
jgi:glutamate/aspartate transport system substrate-binding protein